MAAHVEAAHRGAQGQQWRKCGRCYRPFDRSESGGGCPHCYPALCPVRRLDRKVDGRSLVWRVSPVGQAIERTS